MDLLATAPATFALLLVNTAVSLYALAVNPGLFEAWSLRPAEVLRGKDYQRLVTAGFLHVSLGHLFFNMLTLYFFGPPLEQLLGTPRFFVLYFGSELVSSVFTVWRRRTDAAYSAIGASGAITGVLFAFCLFAPLAMLYLFFAIPMPAVLFAVLYVAGSIYAMRHAERTGVSGGVSHEAHLGGALGGVLLTLAMRPDAAMIFLSELGLLR